MDGTEASTGRAVLSGGRVHSALRGHGDLGHLQFVVSSRLASLVYHRNVGWRRRNQLVQYDGGAERTEGQSVTNRSPRP